MNDAVINELQQMGGRVLQQLTYNPDEPLLFSSGLFLFLFLGFTFVYMLLQRQQTLRLLFVTCFSYYFYYKSSGLYFFLLAVVTVSDFLLARRISSAVRQWQRRLCLIASLVVDLGLLFYFKYTNFFCATWADIVGHNFQPYDIFLPVGISFFTFQSLSYTIDVYRRQMKPLRGLLDYAFYVSFFPQLVAGPIVRARDFVPQIRKPIIVTDRMFGRAVYLICAGLLKKCVVSDYISLNFVDRIFDNPTLYSGVENLLGAYGYALQIYCDFSGYSDMAIGLALLLGFHFPQNFNAPYQSRSITEFWRRWHISLSTWIRDYIYISLGGNRHGRVRQYFNLIVTMLLGGLWHGASFNFVIWGGLHGMALAVHKLFSQQMLHRDSYYQSQGVRRFFAVLFTFHFVVFCWIFFRNTTLDASWTMVGRIFADFHPELLPQVLSGYRYVFILIVLGYAVHLLPLNAEERLSRFFARSGVLCCAVALAAVIYLVIQVKSSTIQPFIYFQF